MRTNDSAAKFLLMLYGMVQMAGATMLSFGVAMTQCLLVRDDVFAVSGRPAVAWSIAPRTLGRAGAGLSFGAAFWRKLLRAVGRKGA